MYDKALPLFVKMKDPIGLSNVYRSKGVIHFGIGDNSKAIDMYDKALLFFTKVGGIVAETFALFSKAEVLGKLGEKNEILDFLEKGITNLEKVRRQTAFSEMKRIFMQDIYEHFQGD